MLVRNVGSAPIPAANAGRPGPGRAGFAVPAGRTAAPATVSAPAALDGLLLLQEVEDAPARDRRARQHGRAMLDALARLQLALLGGHSAAEALAGLAALAGQCPDASDPGLRDLLGSIALRARVELARSDL